MIVGIQCVILKFIKMPPCSHGSLLFVLLLILLMQRTIKDWHLFLVVLASVLVMAIVITVSLAVDDYKPVRVKYREDPTGENVSLG